MPNRDYSADDAPCKWRSALDPPRVSEISMHSKKAIIQESVRWTVETLNEAVDAELEALPADMRARFVHISRLIEDFGLERVVEPHVKHLRGSLWEMHMKG